MAEVSDVARYILAKLGPMTAMKLQKLVYYSQAWHLVWEEQPLFARRIEAWANGPVCPALYREHRRQFRVSESDIPGNPGALRAEEKSTIDSVVKFYGDKSAMWLSDLTHREQPWREARGALEPGAPSDTEITQAAMAEYYSSL
ncbi:hypothetical protein ASE48_20100 [Mycobacterium sp. Root265]|nr:hypothetical protein ASE48_20100 [Mycobacterium sp. Root265]